MSNIVVRVEPPELLMTPIYPFPPGNTGVTGMKINRWYHQARHPEKVDERTINDTAVTNDDNRLPFVFTGNAGKCTTDAQRKVAPTFATGSKWSERVTVKIGNTKPGPGFLICHAIGFTDFQFLHFIVEDDRNSQGRLNDLGSLAGTG